ncbi:MAG: S8 family peptidase [Desulfobaccales bacterium]
MPLLGIIIQVAALLLFATGAFAQALSAPAMANFKNQAAILHAQKSALTEVQKKINTSIVFYLHEAVLKDKPVALPALDHGVSLNAADEILVDLKANVSDSLISAIKAEGGTIVNAFPQYHAIRARIPITAAEILAGRPDITFIDKAAEFTTNKLTTSEGDVAHNAPTVRSQGYAGTGIKVGVLSDSVDYLAQVQSTGDLPASVTVLPGQAGTGAGEGTAMLEIVYDLAPNAGLYFATANGGKAQFAQNIIDLKNAGCKVIVDDVYYFAESPFQDDVISQAVTTVTNAGVAYFSSAGNDGNVHSSRSGTWEGDFSDSGQTFAYDGSHIHAFSGGVISNQITNVYTSSPSIDLFWSDPLGHSDNDYDLYILNSSGTIIASSINPQTGTQDPYERITGNYTGNYVAISKFSGAQRFLHLAAYRQKLNYNTTGATKGHATVEAGYCVAATTALHRATAFTGAEAVEAFSSDGPRRVFYDPSGNAITPGNLLSTGGKLRVKTDITAADGVACSTPGFNPFYGTSAAAPHAAAIAALLFSAKPGTSAAALRSALTRSALPTPSSWQEWSGYGIIMADRALTSIPKPSIIGAYLPLLLH